MSQDEIFVRLCFGNVSTTTTQQRDLGVVVLGATPNGY